MRQYLQEISPKINQYQVESQFGFSWLVATLIFFGMWFGISLLIDLFEHHSRVYIKR